MTDEEIWILSSMFDVVFNLDLYEVAKMTEKSCINCKHCNFEFGERYNDDWCSIDNSYLHYDYCPNYEYDGD